MTDKHRLPNKKQFKEKVLSNHKLNNADTYLKRKSEVLRLYSSIESFAFDNMENKHVDFDGIEKNLIFIRSSILSVLWERKIYFGRSLLDELIFQVYRNSIGEPIEEIFSALKYNMLSNGGFIVYPIHSVGVLGQGLLDFFYDIRLSVLFEKYGVALTPQLNSEDRFMSFLESCKTSFGLSQNIPSDSVEHYMRSRPIKWTTHNPLVALKLNTFSGEYYENQFIIQEKLRFSISAIYILSALEFDKLPVGREFSLGSSSVLNNFQTFDIKHYLVFEGGRKKNLTLSCIPINLKQTELLELADVSVELNPYLWKKNMLLKDRVFAAISLVEKGYFSTAILRSEKNQSKINLFHKIYDSLKYFCRSSKRYSHEEDQVINLAIAFETLLTDYYQGNIRDLIKANAHLALKGVRGKDGFIDRIMQLYQKRSEIVHSGRTNLSLDLNELRLIYAKIFLVIAEKSVNAPSSVGNPIHHILKS